MYIGEFKTFPVKQCKAMYADNNNKNFGTLFKNSGFTEKFECLASQWITKLAVFCSAGTGFFLHIIV